MTTDVIFTDAEFSFRQDDVTYRVSTEVGDGPARVVVQELREQQPAMEPEGDE